jgi:hypothetical protein
MSRAGFCCLVLLSAPAAALAQPGPSLAIRDAPPAGPPPMDFRISRGDLREAGAPARGGLIGAVSLDERFLIGIGRFNVPELARPRSHTEPERRPGDVRRRDRGIAAVGISYSF